MNPIRWQKSRWLPRFLAIPIPEPAQQASRILAIQRNIILPAKVMVTGVVLYYLYYSHWLESLSDARALVLETLQRYFTFYIFFNAAAATLLIFRRFPPGLVQWIVFTVGLIDGVLLAGLTLETGGFASTLFWVFPGLIVINSLSIPLATPQIVLNLSLSAFYVGAGLLDISVGERDSTMYQSPPLPHPIGSSTFSAEDIIGLGSLAAKLKQPPESEPVNRFLSGQLSLATQNLLVPYQGGSNSPLQRALAADLNRIVKSGPIYEPRRFAGVRLSLETSNLLNQALQGADLVRLNRMLLVDAYPQELSKSHRVTRELSLMKSRAPPDLLGTETGTEPFLLRLMILWLLTASCYGVQLLLLRQQLSEEEERKSAARNDELMAAGRLAGASAHQLKNPLGIINNAAFSLQRGLREGRNDFALQIEIIRDEVERSDRILTQLMGYAQLSEGRVEKLSLPEELDRAIDEVLPEGAHYATQVHRDYGANLPALLMQRSHLSVVLVNLLQNAREAVQGVGNVFVEARCRSDQAIEIILGDDGPGIAADKLGKIFEAYVTTKEKGTGLGLAIVKHNVELYGGSVRAESEPGKGARFVLLFPAKTYINAG